MELIVKQPDCLSLTESEAFNFQKTSTTAWQVVESEDIVFFCWACRDSSDSS